MKCVECGEELGLGGRRGRTPKHCSSACRQHAYRRRKRESAIPSRMTDLNRWARADGKRPIQPAGFAASTTEPATWTSFDNVQNGKGDGFGVMLGEGLVCIDLDDALDENGKLTATAQAVLDATAGAWTEISMSGTGLHIFGAGFECGGRRLTAPDGTGVELYSRERFIRMTGKTFRPGTLPVIDFDDITKTVRSP